MPAHVLQLLHAAAPAAPDAELLARFASTRDEAAFAELVRRHGPVVYRVCRRLVPAAADDAFQATFLVLACRAGSVRRAASVGSWLIGVAGRVARQMARRERRAQGVRPSDDLPDPPAADRTPETAELAAVLDDELTRLPERFRAPVVLCLMNGRTQEQAAAELGGSVRTLRRRLDEAKALLRARLERRGVVPAVAAGLVAGVGAASAAPPGLVRLAVRGATEFLTGAAATSPAAVVAKGVVGSMANLKASALVTVAAAVLIGLGVGAAQPEPRPEPVPDLPAAPKLSVTVPALGPDPRTLTPNLAADGPAPAGERPGYVLRSANFLVSAPNEVIARAVAAEAEFQRKQIGLVWLGHEPPPWPNQCHITVRLSINQSVGATTFDFGTDKGDKPVCRGAKMELSGSFEGVLSTHLPHEVTHVVLAYHVGKPLPRWVDEGIALLSEGREEQTAYDKRCREALNAGRGIRLRVLFRMTEYPRDLVMLYAQGQSVVRFLLAREPVAERAAVPGATDAGPAPGLGVIKAEPRKPHRTLLEFVRIGSDGNTAESWNKAAKELYGFDSLDALEETWLEWLRKPESWPGDAPKLPKAPKPKDDGGGLIPPTELPRVPERTAPNLKPDTITPTGKLVGDTYFVSARKIKLPMHVDKERQLAIRELFLLVSSDKGRTWKTHAAAAPDKTEFTFDAPDDGSYWFAAIENPKDGRVADNRWTDVTPDIKVVVDTTPPVVRITEAKREGAKLSVSWTVTEANPSSVHVLFSVAGGDSDWKAVPTPSNGATATVETGSTAKARVKVITLDAAGNQGASAVVTVE